jgi:ABC-type multidrug transport system fused ATPase/permease subunit
MHIRKLRNKWQCIVRIKNIALTQSFILYEATNALDNITEQAIMDAINNLENKITIILITHRLKTIKNCDTIFFMEKGSLIKQGNYNTLLENCEQFRKMAAEN